MSVDRWQHDVYRTFRSRRTLPRPRVSARARPRAARAALAPILGGPGRLAQLVEHLVYTEGVGGSSPSPPTLPAEQKSQSGDFCSREPLKPDLGDAGPQIQESPSGNPASRRSLKPEPTVPGTRPLTRALLDLRGRGGVADERVVHRVAGHDRRGSGSRPAGCTGRSAPRRSWLNCSSLSQTSTTTIPSSVGGDPVEDRALGRGVALVEAHQLHHAVVLLEGRTLELHLECNGHPNASLVLGAEARRGK